MAYPLKQVGVLGSPGHINPNIATAATNSLLIDRGLVSQTRNIKCYGENTAVGSAEYEVVSKGNILWHPTSASTLRIKAGGDANDSSGGTGARLLAIVGLDGSGNIITDTLSTNGASASSNTTLSYIRVTHVLVLSSGAYGGVNAGNITIETSDGLSDVALMLAGESTTHISSCAIPSNETWYFTSVIVQVDSNKVVDARLCVRESLLTTSAPYNPKITYAKVMGVSGLNPFQPLNPMLILDPLTDIWIEAKSSGQDASVGVYLEFTAIETV